MSPSEVHSSGKIMSLDEFPGFMNQHLFYFHYLNPNFNFSGFYNLASMEQQNTLIKPHPCVRSSGYQKFWSQSKWPDDK